ncbi:DUF6339 family protein [Glycomyces tritici]|uniref:DUF6339 family protein n=1 Tax=Glycomyces tritici TaxID=2665176 RepID=A0ABT7YJ93_9ACTN|nr:DUF6339 family protein [Glycomyces tritici]MDN3238681.1 DUF6339 family protein [Glycomyces tritici]
MILRTRQDLPETLGLLPGAVASKHLTHGVQAGRERPSPVALRKAAEAFPVNEARWSVAPVLDLLDEAMDRFVDDRVGADGWLAPRLHATIRMAPSEAADSRLWNYLALLVAPDYVVWRHSDGETAAAGRFTGPHYTQAFSRLWWAAELFRNGPDYRPVEVACRVQDVLNTTMRLDVIDHRPTAQAILRIVARLLGDGSTRPGDQINALSSAVNTAGSTLAYDVLAPDESKDYDELLEWIHEAGEVPAVPLNRLPDGPEDGHVPPKSVDILHQLFEELLAEAPIRSRSKQPSSGA